TGCAAARLGNSPDALPGDRRPARVAGPGAPVVHPIAAPARAALASRHATPHQAGHCGVKTAGAGMTDSLVIPSRFCGPPGSGNGGYVCGRIAAHVDGPATVTLLRPPPLATPMAVERDREGSVRIHDGPTLIAEAATSPGGPGPQIPGLVTLAQ